MCFLFSYGASQQRPCVRIGLTHAYLSHVKMALANAKSVNRQTLEKIVRNAASEFTRRTAIASLASLSSEQHGNPLLSACLPRPRPGRRNLARRGWTLNEPGWTSCPPRLGLMRTLSLLSCPPQGWQPRSAG